MRMLTAAQQAGRRGRSFAPRVPAGHITVTDVVEPSPTDLVAGTFVRGTHNRASQTEQSGRSLADACAWGKAAAVPPR